MLDVWIQNFFLSFNFIGKGEGELQEKLKKDALFYGGTENEQKNMNIAVLSQGPLPMQGFH